MLVPYDKDDVVVDWISGKIETNVGDSQVQMAENSTGKIRRHNKTKVKQLYLQIKAAIC